MGATGAACARSGAAAVVAVGLAALASLACGKPAELRYEDELARTPAPAAHAVHDVRLAEVMRGLDAVRRERLPMVIDPAAAQARQARDVARVALAMAESARGIRAAVPEALDEGEREAFDALAVQLEAQCRALARDVDALAFEAVQTRLDEIDATCVACHERFRIGFAR